MSDFTQKIKSVILPYLSALKAHLDTLTPKFKFPFVFETEMWEEDFLKVNKYFQQLKTNLPEIFQDLTIRNLPKKTKSSADTDAFPPLAMEILQKDVNLALALLQRYLADQEKPTAKIFISHGPSPSALDRVAQFIRDLGFIPIIAEETPSEGREIRSDVDEKMRGCDCAIILAEVDPDDSTKSKTRENVLIEATKGKTMLQNRLIWLKEEGVKLPSLFRATIWESFTQECLEKAFAKIVRELRAFGYLK